jgi:hypothetical protein
MDMPTGHGLLGYAQRTLVACPARPLHRPLHRLACGVAKWMHNLFTECYNCSLNVTIFH